MDFPAGAVVLAEEGPRAAGDMTLSRLLRHLFYPAWLARRAFPAAAVRRLEVAIRDSEVRHGGEICFAFEASLHPYALWRGQSARDRAIEVFSQLRVWDTEANTGVLIYLLLADRDVEIVVDRGWRAIDPAAWEAICREMETRFQAGRYEEGVKTGIEATGRLLGRLRPAGRAGANELPDRPIDLG